MVKKAVAIKDRKGHSLVGKFFHSVDADKKTIKWQGQIVDEVAPGVFLVQLYEYLMGGESTQVIVPISEMAYWPIYETDQEMREAYERQHPPK
jgi:hypothetical protein